MNFKVFLKESFTGSMSSVFTMAIIIIPLMIVMEILKDAKLLERISSKLKPMAKFLDISDKSIFPLIIGIVFGLSYGAGIIIDSSEEGNLSKKDLYVIVIFLLACHAIFEDTFIFAAVGARLWLVLGVRLTVAIAISYLTSKLIDGKLLAKEY